MSAFDDLHAQLSASVRDRATAASATGEAAGPSTVTDADAPGADARTPRRTRARWWTTRPFALVLVGLSVAGTATAATVVALSGTPSAPLEGRVDAVPPGSTVPASKVFDRYRVSVSPNFWFGRAGWCLTTTLGAKKQGEGGVGGKSCSDAVPKANPVLLSDLGTSFSVGNDPTKENTNSAVVDDRIGGLRTGDGRVYTPRSVPGLPAGFRIVVVPRPGKGNVTVLDTEGQRSKAYDDAPPTELQAQPGSPGAFGLEDPRSPSDPPDQPWGLRSASDGVEVRAMRELRKPAVPVGDVHRGALLVIADARIRHDGRVYRATHFVDATDPDAPAPPLPGARGGRAHGTFEVPANATSQPAMTYRRAGPGWIVVRGPSAAGRDAVLRALRLGPVPTTRPDPGALGPGTPERP